MMFELLLDGPFPEPANTNAEGAIALLPSIVSAKGVLEDQDSGPKRIRKFRHSNHRIGAHTSTNHTVP